MNTGGRQHTNFAGTFVSHPDTEKALHLSEPATHNTWNPNSERLGKADPSYSELVKTILHRIRTQSRRFQKDITPVLPPEPATGTRRLERILARIMSGGFGEITPPTPTPDVFQLDIDERRLNTSEGSIVVASVEVKLREEAKFEEADAFVSVRPTVLLDDNFRKEKSEQLKLAAAKLNGLEVESGEESKIAVRLSKSRTTTVEATSEQFGRGMSAELEVAVSLVEGAFSDSSKVDSQREEMEQ
jgi:hypothetical protein